MMKVFMISALALFVTACASTSEVNDIEQLVLDSQETVTKLDKKIIQLEAERTALAEQLNSIDSNGQSLKSEASALKGKISNIDQTIDSYKKEIVTINSTMSKNTKNITVVKKQQKVQHTAASDAVKENQVLKEQVVDEIRALELEYEAKRRKLEEEQSLEQGDNDGE